MSPAKDARILGRIRVVAMTDEALLAAWRDGDTNSLEELYRRHKAALLGFCALRTGDMQGAEDAVQDIFVKVQDYDGPPIKHVRAWLFAIARNTVVDRARKSRVIHTDASLDALKDVVIAPEDTAVLEALDVTSNVFVALRRLPARDRRALVMREFRDMSSQEIGDEFGMRPGAVDVMLCRARAAFGRAYAEVCELPLACRQTTELIYREFGSGITDQRRQEMLAHTAACERCAAEHRRAHSPRVLGGLVPWWPMLGPVSTALARPILRIRSEVMTLVASIDRTILPGLSMPVKVGVGAAITAVAISPAIVHPIVVRTLSVPPARTAIVDPSEARTRSTSTLDHPSSKPFGANTAHEGDHREDDPADHGNTSGGEHDTAGGAGAQNHRTTATEHASSSDDHSSKSAGTSASGGDSESERESSTKHNSTSHGDSVPEGKAEGSEHEDSHD